MQQAAEQASMESEVAKDAAKTAMDKLETVPVPGHESFFGTTLLDTVTADREAKEAQRKHQELIRLQHSERALVETYIRKYSAYITSYNMSWQSWLATLEAATNPEMVNLILLDPPYDVSFISSNQQKHLATLFDKTVLPGGTALIWCRWKCINRWANVFQQHTLGTDWVVENVLAVTRHPKHSFRSPVNGHKQMTEFVLIAHRKDEKSSLKSLKQGKKVPMITELEGLFGDASAGSWTYDFMTNSIPPLKNWYVTFVFSFSYVCECPYSGQASTLEGRKQARQKGRIMSALCGEGSCCIGIFDMQVSILHESLIVFCVIMLL